MFATSTLLLSLSKLGLCAETGPLLQSAEMGVEILEAMEESVVARKSVEIIKQYLRNSRAAGAPQPRGEEEPLPIGMSQEFEVPVCLLVPFFSEFADGIGMGTRLRLSRLFVRRYGSSIRGYWRLSDDE